MSETQNQETQVSQEDKPYITKPNDLQDLERRQADDYQADAELASRRTFVNPNPFGNDEYVGTDPIYQNYASDTEAPLAAKEGALKAAEDEVKAAYKIPDSVAETRVVDDPGMGGKALVADVSVVSPPEVTIGKVDRDESAVPEVKVEKQVDEAEQQVPAPAETPPTFPEVPPATPSVPTGH